MSALQDNVHEDMLIKYDLIEIYEIERQNEIRRITISMTNFNISLEELSRHMKNSFTKND
mgnify:CR=1 FL=1